MTGPNGAGDRDPAGVFSRVRRDRQISNLLYGLLGAEDEIDPRAALDSLATSAAATLDACGPEYRVRVVRACQLLTGLVLDAAENAQPVLRAEDMRHMVEVIDARQQNPGQDARGSILPAETPHPGTSGTPNPADGHTEPRVNELDGPHPYHDRRTFGVPEGTCVCGQPSGAVEHFQPIGIAGMPTSGPITIVTAPADVHPVTGHKLTADFTRYGGVDEEPAPCPTCGYIEGVDLDHAITCPERD